MIPDSHNNAYFLVLGAEDVGRIDAKSGAITIFKTPTPRSGPRRGMMDAQDRLWFGENNGDRIGMFDTRSERFQEWKVPTPGAWPYDVTADGQRFLVNSFGENQTSPTLIVDWMELLKNK